MKSILYFIILSLAFLSLRSNAISRFPINSSSKWRVDHIRNGVSDENKHENGDDISTYFINGDTLIGENKYFKLYKSGIAYLETPYPYTNIYQGALRDEDNKFFFIEKNRNKEVLLYNFNAMVDDTIQVPYDGVFEEKVISAIDTLIDGRKLIHFNPKIPIMGCGDQYIIEGIGGSGGLLEGPECNHFWTDDNHLVCYIQDDVLKYHNKDFLFNCEIVQPPTHYFDSTCVWRVDKQKESELESDFEKITYHISGDTVLNGINYLKLYKTGYQLLIQANGDYFSGYNNAAYMGALREFDEKAYFITNGESNEKLLYDFSVEAKSLIEGEIYKGDTVISVGNVLDNRRIIYLSQNFWEKNIIQGIGSDKGFLETDDENSILVCFTKGGNSLYYFGTGEECVPSFLELNFNNCDKVKVIPSNPTTSDDIKLAIQLCLPISYNNPIEPVISNCEKEFFDNTILIQITNNFDDRNNEDQTKKLVPLFDTIQIGKLNEGEYIADIALNTIHKGINKDYTTEGDKYLYAYFNVAKNNTDYNPLKKSSIKVYYLSSAKNDIVIENFENEIIIESVAIYDAIGRKKDEIIISGSSNQHAIHLSLENLSKGIFLLKLNCNKGTLTKKIIHE